MARIIQRPELHGGVYHLTPENPVTVRETEAAIADYFNYEGVQFVGKQDLQTSVASDAEQDFYSVINSGAGQYWRSEPEFDTTRRQQALPGLPCPQLTPERLRRLIDFAVRDQFGRRRAKRATPRPASRERASGAGISPLSVSSAAL
jgi:hypothetical protein